MRYTCFSVYEIFSTSNGERKIERGNDYNSRKVNENGNLYCRNKETHCLFISVRL